MSAPPSHVGSSPPESEREFGPEEALEQYEADCQSHSDLTLVLGQMGFVSMPPNADPHHHPPLPQYPSWEPPGSPSEEGLRRRSRPGTAAARASEPRIPPVLLRARSRVARLVFGQAEELPAWSGSLLGGLFLAGMLLLLGASWWGRVGAPTGAGGARRRGHHHHHQDGRGAAWPADAALCSGLRKWDLSGLVNGSQGLALLALEHSVHGGRKGRAAASAALYAHLRGLLGDVDRWWRWGAAGPPDLIRVLILGPHAPALGGELASKDLLETVAASGVVHQVTCAGVLLGRDSFWLDDEDSPTEARLGVLGSVLAGRLLVQQHQRAAQGGEGTAVSTRREALSLVDPAQVRAAKAWMCDAIAQAKRRIAWSGKRSRTSLLVVEDVVDLLEGEGCSASSKVGHDDGHDDDVLGAVRWIHRYFTADAGEAGTDYLLREGNAAGAPPRWQAIAILVPIDRAAVARLADAAAGRLGSRPLFGGWLRTAPVLALVQWERRGSGSSSSSMPGPPPLMLTPAGYTLLHTSKQGLVDRRWGRRALDIFCAPDPPQGPAAADDDDRAEGGDEGHPCYAEFCDLVWGLIGSPATHDALPMLEISRLVLEWQQGER